ncbi:MAG: hypothetical protein LBJ18_04005 [Rickettsiales bacterium]|jgi:hypothetical protein|nr:hypothetical protein [Rickettsiales bacterium]
MKKIIYILVAAALCAVIGYRVYSIHEENQRAVFNAARMEAAPVETIVMREKMDSLKEPLFIKNNTAKVSSARVYRFGIGQHIGTGRIISVSTKIDLDSGMHIIKTSGAGNGLQFAESHWTGFFVPVSAIQNNSVMIMENGTAVKREVKVANRDAVQAFISRGLRDGDIVILSTVAEGAKVISNQ